MENSNWLAKQIAKGPNYHVPIDKTVNSTENEKEKTGTPTEVNEKPLALHDDVTEEKSISDTKNEEETNEKKTQQDIAEMTDSNAETADRKPLPDNIYKQFDDISKKIDILAKDYDTTCEYISRLPMPDAKQLGISLHSAVTENLERTLVALQKKSAAEREERYDALLELVKQINDEVLRIKTALSIMIDIIELIYKRLGGDKNETNAPANTTLTGKEQNNKKDSLPGTSDKTANIAAYADEDASMAKRILAWFGRDSGIILPNSIVLLYIILLFAFMCLCAYLLF